MSFLKKGSKNIGDVYREPEIKRFWNRTGATLLKGQVAMMDIALTQAETLNRNPGDENSCWANLTPVTQTGVDNGWPIVVCYSDTVADNASGLFVCAGQCEVAVCDDDVSTTDIDIGDPVSQVVSESATAVQAFVTGAVNRVLGLALEDAAASSATAARTVDASSHLRNVWWTGAMYPMVGQNDT